jgi:putative Holliday junction resolvase
LSILALDLGAARIGVAVKPAGQSMVLPLSVVPAEPEAAAFERLRGMIRERDAAIVVVGLPLNENPEQALRVKRTLRRLRRGVQGVRWRFCDETLTSAAAADIGRDPGDRGRYRPDDDRAAALILESWLASAERQGIS